MIEITNIKYDLDGTRGYEEYYQHAVCDGLTREQMLEKLPSSISNAQVWVDEVLEDSDEIEDKDDFVESLNYHFQKRIEEKGWLCLGFSYKFSIDRFGLLIHIDETYEEPPFKEQMKKWEESEMPMPGGV